MSRYWLTIHWPHPVDEREDHAWCVHLQDRYKEKGEQLSPGDMVAFYETGQRKRHLRQDTSEPVDLKPGRKAVVGIAEVSGPLRESTLRQKVRQYTGADGAPPLNWAWEVPCHHPRWGQPVPYDDLLVLINRGNVRIRGGTTELPPSQFEELRRRLRL